MPRTLCRSLRRFDLTELHCINVRESVVIEVAESANACGELQCMMTTTDESKIDVACTEENILEEIIKSIIFAACFANGLGRSIEKPAYRTGLSWLLDPAGSWGFCSRGT